MRSIDVANLMVTRHGGRTKFTNMILNKLVYFAQVESLRMFGAPLFDDAIEAWDYGPVEPAVYYAFKCYGRSRIASPSQGFVSCDENALAVVDKVIGKYGCLGAFDLVELTHRAGSAWSKVYKQGLSEAITVSDILSSADMVLEPDPYRSLAAGFRDASSRWSNTLRILEDA